MPLWRAPFLDRHTFLPANINTPLEVAGCAPGTRSRARPHVYETNPSRRREGGKTANRVEGGPGASATDAHWHRPATELGANRSGRRSLRVSSGLRPYRSACGPPSSPRRVRAAARESAQTPPSGRDTGIAGTEFKTLDT